MRSLAVNMRRLTCGGRESAPRFAFEATPFISSASKRASLRGGRKFLRTLFAAWTVAVFASPVAALGQGRLNLAASLRGYLQIDTTTPAGEAAAAAYLAAELHRHGIPTQTLVTADGRPSLFARLEATTPNPAAPVVLLHHLDVVAPGPGWELDPYSGLLRDGYLHGRGALDTKSLGVAGLGALLELTRPSVKRTRPVIFLAAADEETGGTRGTGWIFANRPELLRGAAGVLNEGGSARQVNGRMLWWEVEVAQKRPLWLEVRASGRGGHAAGLNPHSAVHQLVSGLARLVEMAPEYRVTPAARRFLQALAPLHNDRWQPILADIDRHMSPTGPRSGLFPGMASLFIDTIQVTVLEGSSQINVTPAEARARVDIRLLPDSDSAVFLERVRERLGPDLDVEVLLTAPPSPPSPEANPVYAALTAVLGKEAPVVPAFKPGFTDSRWFREQGIPAYGFTPFALEPQDLRGIHGADERIPVAELERGAERFAAILRVLVAP